MVAEETMPPQPQRRVWRFGIWQATGALDLQRKEEAFQARKKWREKNPSPLGTQRTSSFFDRLKRDFKMMCELEVDCMKYGQETTGLQAKFEKQISGVTSPLFRWFFQKHMAASLRLDRWSQEMEEVRNDTRPWHCLCCGVEVLHVSEICCFVKDVFTLALGQGTANAMGWSQEEIWRSQKISWQEGEDEMIKQSISQSWNFQPDNLTWGGWRRRQDEI